MHILIKDSINYESNNFFLFFVKLHKFNNAYIFKTNLNKKIIN